MYNGTNGTNPTDPPIAGGLTAYEIVTLITAVFAGLATLLGAITCYRQQANSKDIHSSEATLEVKRTDSNGVVKEVIYSIHINDDEGYNTSTTSAQGKKKSQTNLTKKQTDILIIEEKQSDDSNDAIEILAGNDTKSDIQRNHTNQKLIDHSLTEFHDTVKLVFGHVHQDEIKVTGNIMSTHESDLI